jgi:hypothetical protein
MIETKSYIGKWCGYIGISFLLVIIIILKILLLLLLLFDSYGNVGKFCKSSVVIQLNGVMK